MEIWCLNDLDIGRGIFGVCKLRNVTLIYHG